MGLGEGSLAAPRAAHSQVPAPASALIYCPKFHGDFSTCFSGSEMPSPFSFWIQSMRKTLEIDFGGPN